LNFELFYRWRKIYHVQTRVLTRWLLPFVLLGFSFLWDLEAHSYHWGPACQWMRLYGRVELPPGMKLQKPILLTVTYQLEDQKIPAILLTNYPLRQRDFVFVLSDTDESIEGVVFLPYSFPFDQHVRFQYFVMTSDGRYHSEPKTIEYHPERKKVDGQLRCQTALHLEPRILTRRR
jgi:hypothetical protein